MLANIKSNSILKKIFLSLKSINCLEIIRYNKSFQNKLSKNIGSYKELAKVYRIIDKNLNVKEYNIKTNELIFEGKLMNGKKNGFGKLYDEGNLIYEGEWKNNEKNGFGKLYGDSQLIFEGFEGIFLNGKEWEGKGTIICFNEVLGNIEKYIGSISEGKMNGEGKKISKDGNIVYVEYTEYEGNFVNSPIPNPHF